MKALYNIYIVSDVYYYNKYEIIVYIYKCSQCHNYNVLVVPHARRTLTTSDDFTIRLITETFTLT